VPFCGLRQPIRRRPARQELSRCPFLPLIAVTGRQKCRRVTCIVESDHAVREAQIKERKQLGLRRRQLASG